MTMRNAVLAFVTTLATAAPAFAQTAAPAPSRWPALEVAFGFNGPQASTAEFPGLTASLAVLVPVKPRFGLGVVAEGDASYTRLSRTAGVRVYSRAENVTVFAQLLAGDARATDQGIIHATGGRQIQPGAGVSIGWWKVTIFLEGDYRHVSGGAADTNTRTNEVKSWSGGRFVTGVVFRLRRW